MSIFQVSSSDFKLPIIGIDHKEIRSWSQAGQDLFVIAVLQGKRNGRFLEIGANDPICHNNTFVLEQSFNFLGVSVDILENTKIWKTPYKSILDNFYQKVRDSSWPESINSFSSLTPEIQKELIEIHGYENFVGVHKLPVDDLSEENKIWPNIRPNSTYLHADALELDYNFVSGCIDYLQIDIDTPANNLAVLEKLVDRARFSVITFEHDCYIETEQAKISRAESRQLLTKYGYEMIANDIAIPNFSTDLGSPMFFEDWYVDPQVISNDIINAYRYVTETTVPKYFYEVLFKPSCQSKWSR